MLVDSTPLPPKKQLDDGSIFSSQRIGIRHPVSLSFYHRPSRNFLGKFGSVATNLPRKERWSSRQGGRTGNKKEEEEASCVEEVHLTYIMWVDGMRELVLLKLRAVLGRSFSHPFFKTFECLWQLPTQSHGWETPLTHGHFTYGPRAVTMKLWEPKRKCPKAIPTNLQNHVVWLWTLKCNVFMWVFTHDKIE